MSYNIAYAYFLFSLFLGTLHFYYNQSLFLIFYYCFLLICRKPISFFLVCVCFVLEIVVKCDICQLKSTYCTSQLLGGITNRHQLCELVCKSHGIRKAMQLWKFTKDNCVNYLCFFCTLWCFDILGPCWTGKHCPSQS
jgi:hypothetical protein